MRIRSGFPNVVMFGDEMGFGGSRTDRVGCSAISNSERDPRETGDVAGTRARVRGP